MAGALSAAGPEYIGVLWCAADLGIPLSSPPPLPLFPQPSYNHVRVQHRTWKTTQRRDPHEF